MSRPIRSPVVVGLVSVLQLGASLRPSAAQAVPEPPPPAWTGSVSAGLAVTSGNSDTQNYNFGFAVQRDPKARNLFKAEGLYLRGQTDGELSVDRLSLLGRDEYRFSDRGFVFGQAQYLSDEFKEIDHLVSPTAGIGYRLVDRPGTRLTVDAGAGGVWEKNTGRGVEASGAVSAGQKLELHLSDTAALTQLVTGLWKMDDLADGLYTSGVGLVASVTARSQVKAELLNTYKHKPPDATVQKNDVAIVLALVYKF